MTRRRRGPGEGTPGAGDDAVGAGDDAVGAGDGADRRDTRPAGPAAREPAAEPKEADGEPQDADADASDEGFLARFPALLRLGGRRQRGRIPVVRQLTGSECGAACLTMVLGYHGKDVALADVRAATVSNRDGATALDLVETARTFGLVGRGVKLEVEDLDYLEPASIIHWDFSHFVVFERLDGDFVHIVDPAGGRRRVPMAQFRRSFTGVALLFEPAEDFEPGRRERGHVWPYLKTVLGDGGLWVRILVVSALLQVFALATPLLTGALVDRVVPRHDTHLLAILAAGFGGVVAFTFLASYVRAHLLLHLRTFLDVRMTLGFLDHLVDLPYSFFQARSTGDLMMRLSSNATVREIVTSGALSTVLDGVLVCSYLLLLFFASPTMALVALGLAVCQLAIFVFARRRQSELLSDALQAESRARGWEAEMLSGIETLKTMAGERRAVERWSHLFVDVQNLSLERGRLDALVESLLATLRLASPLAILAVGALLVLDGKLSLGDMLALSALAAGFLGPVGTLVSTAFRLQLLGSYLERLDDVLSAEREQARGKARRRASLKGRITLEGVSFRYAPNAPLVVRDVAVDIRPGQCVAIVGRSGAGKSTLAGLLVGLYLPTEGRIAFDDADLADLDLRSVRRQIGVVSQRPYLFAGSIRSNIALADPDRPLDDVVEAARRAHIHADILEMPMGYETLVLDGGSSLSGGQRQRLALARALLLRPKILLLDEATSALDSVTERLVQAELDRLSITRIVIAHRLSTVVGADLILVMDDGRVVEQGTHDELLRRGGVYAGLVSGQLSAPVAAAGAGG